MIRKKKNRKLQIGDIVRVEGKSYIKRAVVISDVPYYAMVKVIEVANDTVTWQRKTLEQELRFSKMRIVKLSGDSMYF